MSVVTSSLLPDPPTREHPEDDFQRQLVAFLQVALPHDALYFHVPNGGLRAKKVAGRLKGLGLVAGVPDLCVIHRGRALFLELKTKRGVVSQAQRNLHRLLVYCGADVMVVRSVPEAEAALREACVPLRATVLALGNGGGAMIQTLAGVVESTEARKRAEIAESTMTAERAALRESTVWLERAVSAESTVPRERAGSHESTVLGERP